MGKVISTVLKPFQKIAGGSRSQVPAGYELVQTGTQTIYRDTTGTGPGQRGYTLTEKQYSPRENFLTRFKAEEKPVFEVLPINRNQQTAPASPSVPPPNGSGSPAPPSGGFQPTQPAQPTTDAVSTLPKIQPAPPFGSDVPVGGAPQGGTTAFKRRRGKNPFVKTTTLGISEDAQTYKETLGS